MFSLRASIRRHPRIETAVEVEVTKGGEYAGSWVYNKSTLQDSIAVAKKIMLELHPALSEGDIDVVLV
jgi:hypothetical protein